MLVVRLKPLDLYIYSMPSNLPAINCLIKWSVKKFKNKKINYLPILSLKNLSKYQFHLSPCILSLSLKNL